MATDDTVLITRTTGGDTTGGKPVPTRDDGRVYITEVYPGMAADVYSSTTDVDQATRFTRARATRLLNKGLWRDRAPRLERPPEQTFA